MKTLLKSAVIALAAAGLGAAALTVNADGHGNHKHSHVATVGEKAPEFTLTDLNGTSHNLSDFAGKTVILEWFNPQCPFVVKQYEKTSVMKDTFNFANDNGDVVWLAINSGAPGKQGHGVELNKKMKAKWGIENAILVDESGKVGKAYGAKTTPHMFVIDADGIVRYNGAIDNNRSPNKAGDTNHVINALKNVFAGETVEVAETKPYGCSVKYAK